MKALDSLKWGVCLGAFLFLLQRILFFYYAADLETKTDGEAGFLSVFLFGIIVFLMLMRNDVGSFFLTGTIGLITLLTLVARVPNATDGGAIYVYGWLGSFLATIVAFILIVSKAPCTRWQYEETGLAQREKKFLTRYGAVTVLSFGYLVLPQNAGVSLPIFVLLQMGMLGRILPDQKRLVALVPMLVFALHGVISDNSMWRISNFVISFLCYGFLYASHDYFKQLTAPIYCFSVRRFFRGFDRQKLPMIRRVMLAVGISIPVAAFLLWVLSSADLIVAKEMSSLAEKITSRFHGSVILKGILALAAGGYCTGLLSYALQKKKAEQKNKNRQISHSGDEVVISIVLGVAAAIYTLFCVIQFRYLFAVSDLPFGLSYTEYARRGFFELLALTVLNLSAVLPAVYLTKNHRGMARKIPAGLCAYLCVMTGVLLSSSCYRMYLYCADDGLTRLRFLVFFFLAFEALGLILAFCYCIRPHFPVVKGIAGLAIAYYLLMNLVPVDYIVAKNQVSMYLNHARSDIDYVFTLSADAAPQIERLLDSPVRVLAKKYFQNRASQLPPSRWQRWCLPREYLTKVSRQWQ